MEIDYYDSDVIEYNEKFVIINRKINLPKNKTTFEGTHPKLKKDSECEFPERADCNSGLFYRRCKHMKYNQSGGTWSCEYKK